MPCSGTAWVARVRCTRVVWVPGMVRTWCGARGTPPGVQDDHFGQEVAFWPKLDYSARNGTFAKVPLLMTRVSGFSAKLAKSRLLTTFDHFVLLFDHFWPVLTDLAKSSYGE